MVINLAMRGYCNAGVCMSVWLSVCGYAFAYMCVRSPISHYKFVKCWNIFTQPYIEIIGYIGSIPGKNYEHLLVGGCLGKYI